MSKAKKAARKAARANSASVPAVIAETPRMRIALGSSVQPAPAHSPWQVAQPMPGVVPSGGVNMALDDGLTGLYNGWVTQAANGFSGGADMAWLGYPFLAELAQRPEYRRISETFAKEMTRKWIKIQAVGEDDKSDRIKTIEDAMTHFKVQHTFRRGCEIDGFFGRGQIYIDTGQSDNDEELTTVLTRTPAKVPRDSLKHLTIVEPVWTYPGVYNSSKPLRNDFYRPKTWYVMGQHVHASRLLTLVAREVPDLLRPAYAFGGLSLTQIARPYVENWLRTRQSVSDMLHSFSTSGIKTNMAAELSGADDQQIMRRAHMYNQMRDNRGLMMIDKDLEEFFNVSAPLGTLDKLQAQAQEQMSSVAGIPLVILLGISPSGLNASSDGEIKVFENWIGAQQEQLFTDPLKHIMDIIQLSVCGDIDPDISFRYEPLGGLDEAAKGALRKTDCDTDVAYLNSGVLAPIEVRKRIANDENSLYPGLDVEDVPAPPMQPGMEGAPPNGEDEPGGIADLLRDALANQPQAAPDAIDVAGPLRTALVPMAGRTDEPAGIADALRKAIVPSGPDNVVPLLRKALGQDKGFDPGAHPRGQPENKGEFAKTPGGVTTAPAKPAGQTKGPTAAPASQTPVAPPEGPQRVDPGKAGQAQARAAAALGAKTKVDAGFTPTIGAGKARTQPDGSPLPEHIRKLALPPAWTNVRFNPDPNGKLLAQGVDAQGKTQSKYGAAHTAESHAEKHARVAKLMADFPAIVARNEAAKADPKTADLADTLDLVMKMGVRPGSETDTKSKVQAYGATTLQGQHVVTDPDGKVRLDFTGKDGVHLNLPVSDPELAKRLQARAASSGPTGKIFGTRVNDKTLLAHAHNVGGEYKVKDYRTRLGTATAHSLVRNMGAPQTVAERKKSIMEVAKRVSAVLGNEPQMALKAYIAPSVFAHWSVAA